MTIRPSREKSLVRAMATPSLTFAVLICVLVSGCDDTSTPGSNGTRDNEPGVSCPTSGDIRDGFGVCRTPCANDGQCNTATEQCQLDTGLCVLREGQRVCQPASCQQGWVCPVVGTADDDGSGECIPGTGYCAEDIDCDLGQRCDAGRCISRAGDVVLTCETAADCGPLLTCQLGVCVGCLDDLQCAIQAPDSSCVFGTCVVADLGPAGECINKECPDGQRCNVQSGICEETCTSEDDCEPTEICAPVLQRCVADPGCTGDGGCPGTLTCAGAGVIGDTGFCTGCCADCADPDLECAEGLVCILETCLPDVSGSDNCGDVTCLEDELCDALDGSCYPADGTCAGNGDCRSGHTCNFLGVCSGCSVDGDCRIGQRCLLGACLPI